MTPELIAFLGQYGLPITMFVVGLAAGMRGIWVWGRELAAANFRAERAELAAKEWQAIALDAMRAGAKVIEKVANGKPT